MKYREVMNELKSLGTAQNRKVYARHGIGPKMHGVSFANLRKLRQKIKTHHRLAQQLWRSGNHDARVLATQIADPAATESRLLDAWARDLDNYVITDAFAGLASRSRFAQKKVEIWTKRKKEWVSRAGWGVLSRLAVNSPNLEDEYFTPYLERIESEIHQAKNRTRDAMNNALIAIGTRNNDLERLAIAVARKIGKVEVDHGETGCGTPDAIDYIFRVKARRHRTGKTSRRTRQTSR